MSIVSRRARRMAVSAVAICLMAVLVGCAAEPDRTLTAPDGTVCRVYLNSRGAVRRLELSEPADGDSTHRLSPDSRVRDSGKSLEFVDANFDGRLDVRLVTRCAGDSTYYTTYIRGDSGYYTVSALDALPSPTLHPETGTISSPYSHLTIEPATDDFPEVYISEAGTNYYCWQQGALRLTARDSYTYYSESEIYCVARWEMSDDGTLEPAEERWLDPARYSTLPDAPELIN